MTQAKPQARTQDKPNSAPASQRSTSHSRRAKTASPAASGWDRTKAPDAHHYSALSDAIRSYAEAEFDAIAFQIVQRAKRGDVRSLELISATLEQDRHEVIDFGPIETLDEIAAALRIVIASVAAGRLSSSDATRLSNMLVELRQTIMNFDIPMKFEELEAKLNDA